MTSEEYQKIRVNTVLKDNYPSIKRIVKIEGFSENSNWPYFTYEIKGRKNYYLIVNDDIDRFELISNYTLKDFL